MSADWNIGAVSAAPADDLRQGSDRRAVRFSRGSGLLSGAYPAGCISAPMRTWARCVPPPIRWRTARAVFTAGISGLHDKIKPLLKTATASFGITALNELQELYNGKSLWSRTASLPSKSLEHINEKVDQFKEEDGQSVRYLRYPGGEPVRPSG